MYKNLIQTLDFDDFKSGSFQERKAFINHLTEEFTTVGFFLLKNHGIRTSTLETANKASRDFFALPEEVKKAYEKPELDHQVGFTPFGIETAIGATDADAKEFFQLGDRVKAPYVNEIPAFTPTYTTLFEEFRYVYRQLLSAVALSLGLHESYFDAKEGNSIVRAIFYPPHAIPIVRDEDVVKGGNAIGMCSAAHTDINMIPLLHATKAGLQLLVEGKWIPITIDPDTIVVNCGDLLEHLTAGYYKSGSHRVVCEPNTPRYSVPFFGHIKPEESIVPLQQFTNYDKAKFPHTTAGGFLNERLAGIGLKNT